MHYPRKRYSFFEFVVAMIILTIVTIVVVEFVVSLEIKPTSIDTLDITATQNPIQIINTPKTNIEFIKPASTFSSFEISKVPQIASVSNFVLYSLAGDRVELSDFKGQPIILNFWASWCGPCRYEMPEFIRIYETYQDKGLVILAVNMTYQDELEAVQDFVADFDFPFSVLLDEDGTVTNEYYSVLGVPMTFFIKTNGTIAAKYIGAMTGQQLDTFVEALVES